MRLPTLFFAAILVAGSGGETRAQQGLRAGDTASVFFLLDKSNLAAAAQKTLDSLRYYDALVPGQTYAIIGYADFVGRTTYNDSLSLRRATAVKNYLVELGLRDTDLRLVTGLGEVGGRDTAVRGGYAPDRRVDIVRSGPSSEGTPSTAAQATQPRVQKLEEPVKTAPALDSPITSIGRLPVESTVLLKNVYFPLGRHRVLPHSYPALDELARVLAAQPAVRVRIEGHVCCVDPRYTPDAIDEETLEYALSVNRARYIRDYLVKRGVAPNQLEYIGFGKTRPVAFPERTPDDTQRNRRVELRVIGR